MFAEVQRRSRFFFVAVGFFVFGVVGLLQLIAFPIINLLVREPQARASLARDFIGWSFSSLIGFLRFTRVLDYKVRGAEKLQRRGLLILANHPTFLDIVFSCRWLIDQIALSKARFGATRFFARRWKLPASRPQFSIEVQGDIDVQQFISQAGIENLAARI